MIFIANVNAKIGRENDLLDWFDHVHTRDLLAIRGYVSVQRYELSPLQRRDMPPSPYSLLAIYEVEGQPDDLLADLAMAREAGRVRPTDTVLDSSLYLWVPSTPRTESASISK